MLYGAQKEGQIYHRVDDLMNEYLHHFVAICNTGASATSHVPILFFAHTDANFHASLFANADFYFLPMLIPADADPRLYV